MPLPVVLLIPPPKQALHLFAQRAGRGSLDARSVMPIRPRSLLQRRQHPPSLGFHPPQPLTVCLAGRTA